MTYSILAFSRPAYLLVALTSTASLLSTTAWAQEIPAMAHSLNKKCVSDAGILLCTECRLKAGLAPILTPGNADWKINAVFPRSADGEQVNAAASFEVVEDDKNEATDASDDKKRKRSKKKGDRKKNGSDINAHETPRLPMHVRPFSPQPDWHTPAMPQPPMHQPSMSQPPHNMAPVHPEVIELMQNMNRTLKSIESMMRQEYERQPHKPNPNFVPQWSPQPQMHWPQPMPPQMNIPQPSNPPQFQDRRNLGEPRNDGPRNDGPRNDGPRNSFQPSSNY